MGDRYTFNNKCPYCGDIDEVWYAPSCGSLSHTCHKCKKEYIIAMEFIGKKATKKEIKKLYKDNGFSK